ncbi:MAG TPA: tRNA-intron lyase [archaeon]|nr:tRNA-intron lyase [archaeon]
MEGKILKDRVVVWKVDEAKDVFERDYFGKIIGERLELALLEAVFLVEKDKLNVKKGGKKLDLDSFKEYCGKIDHRFDLRYAVYRDLRSKELPTRTGFKFGCDFRVYAKGVKPIKRGPKAAHEHTKWVVFSVEEGYKFSFQELSRAVRLAHNIRANMLWAVVSKDSSVKYYSVTFFKP